MGTKGHVAGVRLSPRQTQICALLVDGLSDKEIAGALRIGENGVNSHLRIIFKKFNVHSRIGAAVRYLQLRAIPPERVAFAETTKSICSSECNVLATSKS